MERDMERDYELTDHYQRKLNVVMAVWLKRDVKGRDDYKAFAEFLGYPWTNNRTAIVNFRNPEVVEKINLINGLNGFAILKMLIVRKEDENAKADNEGSQTSADKL